jgi:hypothetical protein
VPEEYIYNSAMGGITAGVHSPFHINSNPAYLPKNRYTTFDLGATGEYKKLTSKQNSVSDGYGNLRYLAFAFPIASKYTISVGLKPLSRVSYDYSRTDKVENDTSTVFYRFRGTGGVNNVFLSQGFQLTKSLGVGLKLAYNFGAVERNYDSRIKYLQSYVLETNYQTNYHGVSIAPAVAYSKKLNKDWYLNAGVVYELGNKWGYSSSELRRRLEANSDGTVDYDTISSDINGKVTHPSTLNVGVSIERQFKWLVGADVKMQDWSKFKSIDGSETLESINSFSLGGQYIPNLNAVKGYLNRVVYRIGVYYTQNKYSLTNKNLNDIGATIGFDFPVGRLSFLNVAFAAGKRGNKNDNLVQESYYRMNIGVTINDRWFVRSKFD